MPPSRGGMLPSDETCLKPPHSLGRGGWPLPSRREEPKTAVSCLSPFVAFRAISCWRGRGYGEAITLTSPGSAPYSVAVRIIIPGARREEHADYQGRQDADADISRSRTLGEHALARRRRCCARHRQRRRGIRCGRHRRRHHHCQARDRYTDILETEPHDISPQQDPPIGSASPRFVNAFARRSSEVVAVTSNSHRTAVPL